MFTVKWVADNGAEQLVQTKEVNYSPGSDMEFAGVSFYDLNGVHTQWTDGDVYVMNETGKTVSHYKPWLFRAKAKGMVVPTAKAI